MTDLKISISDELMERLRPHLNELPRVLELGVERLEQSAESGGNERRDRIIRLLVEQGLAKSLDKRLLPEGVLDSPRREPLRIPGKPVSEIIIDQRGPR